jgi:WD40 repeat protein
MNRRQFNQTLLAALACPQLSWAAPKSWKQVGELRHGSDINVEQIELSPDARAVASWATDGSLQIWHLDLKRVVWARGDNTRLLGSNRKGFLLLDKGSLKQVDPKTGAETALTSSFEPNCISDNGEWWAGLQEQSNVMLFNTKTMRPQPLSTPPAVYKTEPRRFSFSPDGQWLAVAQGVRNVLWQLSKPDDPIVLDDLPGEISNVRLTKDARWVISGCLGGTLDFYNRLSPRQGQRVQYQGDIRSLSLDAPKNQLLVGCSDGTPYLALQPMPAWPKPSAMAAEPVSFGSPGEAWSVSLRSNQAASGHKSGLLRLWKLG